MPSEELLGWCPSITALSAAQWLDCSGQPEPRTINFWSEGTWHEEEGNTGNLIDRTDTYQRSNGLIGKGNSKIYWTEVAKVIDNVAPKEWSSLHHHLLKQWLLPLLVQGHVKQWDWHNRFHSEYVTIIIVLITSEVSVMGQKSLCAKCSTKNTK